MATPLTVTHATESNWNGLYKAGGAAALVMVIITLAQFVLFVAAPPPLEGSAEDWFALFQKSALLGLLSFEALLVVYTLLSVLVSAALYATLRPASPALAMLFLILSVIGCMAFIMARPGLEMLSLSSQHAAATTEAQRLTLLAAGEATLAAFDGTAFQVSYVIGSVTGLLIGAAMLRSTVFSRTTAYLRIGSGVLDFGIFVPVVGLYISMFSVLFLLAFNVLVGRRLLQLSRAP